MQSPHNKSTRIFMPAAAGIILSLVTSLALAYERTYLLQNPELHGGDLSATLAPERNRIRIGGDVLELRTCSTDWSDMCVSSSYFKLVIPHDVSRTNWSYEGISFERSMQYGNDGHVCLPKDTQQVFSIQGDSMFRFYWSSERQLLGWTILYTYLDSKPILETYLDSDFCMTAD